METAKKLIEASPILEAMRPLLQAMVDAETEEGRKAILAAWAVLNDGINVAFLGMYYCKNKEDRLALLADLDEVVSETKELEILDKAERASGFVGAKPKYEA